VLAWTSVIAIGHWQGVAELLAAISLYIPTVAALASWSARVPVESAWAAASRLLEMHRLMRHGQMVPLLSDLHENLKWI
jgi:hypothetical protein